MTRMAAGNCCATCRHWVRYSTASPRAEDIGRGECRAVPDEGAARAQAAVYVRGVGYPRALVTAAAHGCRMWEGR